MMIARHTALVGLMFSLAACDIDQGHKPKFSRGNVVATRVGSFDAMILGISNNAVGWRGEPCRFVYTVRIAVRTQTQVHNLFGMVDGPPVTHDLSTEDLCEDELTQRHK